MPEMLSRRTFVKEAGAAGMAALCPRSIHAQSPSNAKRPNVLFLFTDDQRFNTIRALGNEHVLTPNMDSLVNEGTAFTNARIMGGLDAAVCMPSRAMLMTGRHLFHIERSGASIPADYVLMPEVFRNAGYTTFAAGKQHNGKEAFARSFSTGGRIFFGGMSGHYKVPLRDFDPSGSYPNDKVYTLEGRHSSEIFASAAVDFLGSYRSDQPFFMYVAFTAPHDPREMPQKFLDMYDPESLPLPRNFLPEHPFDNGELKVRDEQLAPWPRTPSEIRKHLAAYYAMITHVDYEIGRVLAALKASGHDRDTIVVLAGDNGLAVGCHGLMGKQNVYEHSVRVPLVLRGPGIPQGVTRGDFCYLYDIFPTLCELGGLAIPPTVDGISLAPSIKGEPKRVRDSSFHAYKNFQRAVCTGDWKLILYNVRGEHHTQLFDMKRDADETTNRADDPSNAARVREMTSLLKQWVAETGDPVDLSKADWGVPEIPAWGAR